MTTTATVIAMAAVIVLSSTVAYGVMSNRTAGPGLGQQSFSQSQQGPGQQPPMYSSPGMMGGGYSGYGGFPGGMMGGGYGSYPGGMMGSHAWMMSSGWMMGGYYGRDPGTNATYSGQGGALVSIVNYGFYPDSLTVPKGTTVTWVDMDFVQHTVTSGAEQAPTGLFDSHELGHMQSFSHTFDSLGTYTYYCDDHPDMVGTITVNG